MTRRRKLIEAEMLRFITSKGSVSRMELLERFRYLAPRTVRGYIRRLIDRGRIRRVKVAGVYYCAAAE